MTPISDSIPAGHRLPRSPSSSPDRTPPPSAFLDAVGARPTTVASSASCSATVAGLATDDADELDLKIAASALAEMRSAYRVFAPYRAAPEGHGVRFGPHRPDDPLYCRPAPSPPRWPRPGWMVVTGAGPGHHGRGHGGRRPRALASA